MNRQGHDTVPGVSEINRALFLPDAPFVAQITPSLLSLKLQFKHYSTGVFDERAGEYMTTMAAANNMHNLTTLIKR